MGPGNQYEAAITQVGSILEPYDSDKIFPTFGFGGVPTHMNTNQTLHCFPLNGNAQDPGINGVANILAAYKQFLPQIKLSGPTYFGEVLN